MLDSVLQRCAERSPVTVMARLGLQQALEAAWIDELFESHRQSQYRRELLFSSTVELMSVVAVGLQPSVHAAAKAAKDLPVSITALYDKINRTEPGLVRALVCGSAQRLGQVVAGMCEQKADLVPGYQVRILDGNHLPASHKRLKPLRQVAGAALAGQSLVVYDPDRDMVVDLLPCEDAHAQERSLMGPILQSAQPGQLWIADRNFCTGAILAGWHERGSAFLVREHAANPNPVELGRPAQVGRAPTGVVYEQAVRMQSEQGTPILLRRIELRLDAPTEDGDSVIRLLSNLPADQFPGQQIAQLYRRRWKIGVSRQGHIIQSVRVRPGQKAQAP